MSLKYAPDAPRTVHINTRTDFEKGHTVTAADLRAFLEGLPDGAEIHYIPSNYKYSTGTSIRAGWDEPLAERTEK